MTDLELVMKCAEKMGYSGWQSKHGYWNVKDPDGGDHICCNGWNKYDPYSGEKLLEPTFSDAIAQLDYNPLTDDAQAMALVKKFSLRIDKFSEKAPWLVIAESGGEFAEADNHNLNRAICECVANLPEEK